MQNILVHTVAIYISCMCTKFEDDISNNKKVMTEVLKLNIENPEI